uniref:Anoctamin n=1 Tax=Globodera rostochiensis TaxID=31243 RepID=A0A914HN77_GLORO
MSNPKRVRLERLHALDFDETEDILETRSLDEGAVTFAELNKMNPKIQPMKMNKERFELEQNGETSHGTARVKPAKFHIPSSYFSDGKRLIDFVLVYEEKELNNSEDKEDSNEDVEDANSHSSPQRSPHLHSQKRRMYEESLLGLGLELEYANATAINPNIKFVLIHAPFKVLMRQAELMMVRMPVHRNDVRKEWNFTDGFVNACLKRLKFLDFDPRVKKRIEPETYFCQPFVAQHFECFVGYESPETFFSRADRARMVHDLLIRARYDRGESINKLRFGIDKLLRNRTYTAAFPLHDELNKKAKRVDFEKCSDRQLLYESWVKMKNVFKYQPLDLIQNYFGTKIGFYFAWLGYYTRCLWPISLLGILFMLYGVITVSRDAPSNDICEGNIGHELICPICDSCDFVPVNATCLYTRITYVIDNWSTIIFAAIMSIWITLFLEGWKRYHAELAYKWNVQGFEPEEEMMRPEFQFRRKKMSKLNPVTKQEEPYIPFMEKACRLCGSAVTVLFFIFLVLALLFGIIAYRVIVLRVFYASTFLQNHHRTLAIWVTSGTAAMINLIFILIMNFFYSKLALKLTNWECPRTQTEFDNSYTFKVFLFQFVNFYSSLFYIAFIKGRFAGMTHLNRWIDADRLSFGPFQPFEQCEAAGCMVELVIQLAIGYPLLSYWVRRWRFKIPETKKQKAERISKERRQTIKCFSPSTKVSLYEQDYSLNVVYQQFLFDEYLEMVIQLGFVTLFVAAFPLAPLFALINNILEIRLDAYKFIITTQRPVAEQARNIGIWITIINMISNIAVLCNAFVIAFTSDFIPKLYYQLTQETLHGYAEDTFAYFDSSKFIVQNSEFPNTTYCRYQDYRRPPCSLINQPISRQVWGQSFETICDDNYELQDKWWIILAFRLVFVLVFELVVLSIKAIFAYLIPDMPTKIVIQLQRERFLMRQAILQRKDTPEELEAAELEEREQTQLTTDRPNLGGSWQHSGDIDSMAYQADICETEKSSKQKRSSNSGFGGLFSRRDMPSLSPRTSFVHELPLSTATAAEAGDNEKASSSYPVMQKRPSHLWPTPSLLLLTPPSRPPSQSTKTIEVLQQNE